MFNVEFATVRYLRLIAIVWLAVVHTSWAQPIFDVGAAAGDGSVPIAVRVFFDGQQTPVESGSVTFSFDASELQASESCTSRIGDPRPDRLVFTHNVSCTVDNIAGEVSLSFSPFSRGFTVSQRLSLGRIFFSVAEDFVPAPGGTIFALPIEQVSFPGSTGTGSVPGTVAVARGWPIDGFEPDDSPINASALADTIVGQFNSVFGYLQAHTFDQTGDEDWTFFQVGRCGPLQPQLRISPIEPLNSSTFQPLLEVYPAERLANPALQPTQIYGDCSGPAGRDLTVNNLDLTESALLRIRNCQNPSPSGLGYSLRISFGVFCSFGVVTYSGTVSEAGTGISAGVFLRSNANQYGASNPISGRYSIIGLPNDPVELEVISDIYAPASVSLPGLEENVPADDFNIVVTRPNIEIFGDGFE